ncbi:hypothetical protein MalM25_20660 [Planctomycetes bacterium MalM25]|nr:hypothetical protein MalM25_20660 [Planctomycetes bacterium MalM25]
MSTVSSPPPASPSPSEGSGALTFLSAKQLWRPSASGAVIDAWKRDDQAAAWKAWRTHLADRPAPKTEPHLTSGKKPSSLAWGLPKAEGEALDAWRRGLARKVETAQAWLDTLEGTPDRRAALEAVAWAAALPSLAKKHDADTWWRLTETLLRLVEEASAAAAPDPSETEETVVRHLIAGELALVLAKRLPEIRPVDELASDARKLLSQALERLTDGEGLLTAPLWTDGPSPAAPLLLASWTRCLILAGEGKAPWNADAQTQYEWMVRQTLRLSDRQGRFAFAPSETIGSAELIREMLERGGDASDEAAAARRLKGYKADESFETPDTSNHSEWAELGVLSAGWRDKAPRIVVAHPADTMRVEVHSGKHVLFSGEWPVEATIDGVPVQSTDEWDCQCWHTDEDGDYLELALDLQNDSRLERQFFVSREDGVAFIAESLFTEQDEHRNIEITSRLPMGEGVCLRPEKETRDALLSVEGQPVAGVLPLALPEWREDPRGGELTAEDKRLVLTRQWEGRTAVSPLWIDFSAKRFEKQRTWRQLSVAEALKNVSADVAVAYRVQSAKEQWLMYRSLDEPANRTFLGQNYSSEQVVGTFDAENGTIDEYFEIDADDD